jgi:pseudouridine kinase
VEVKEKIVVAGGINLDIKGFSASRPVQGDSNPGRLVSVPGGVARNIAENLSRLGLETVLCGAAGRDMQGEYVLECCRAAGVDVSRVIRSEEHGTGTYLAILDEKGELALALSDMSAVESLRPDMMEGWLEALPDAALLVLDANLPSPVIARLVEEARACRVPVAADPVSISKCGRIAPFLESLDWLFPNLSEWETLKVSFSDGTGTLPCACVISMGSDGVMIIPAGCPADEALRIPAERVRVRDVGGAGDALAAGFCFALVSGGDAEAAARAGIAAASMTLESELTVCPDINPASLRNRIKEHLNEKN